MEVVCRDELSGRELPFDVQPDASPSQVLREVCTLFGGDAGDGTASLEVDSKAVAPLDDNDTAAGVAASWGLHAGSSVVLRRRHSSGSRRATPPPSRRAPAGHAPCPLVELELHVAALEDALYDTTVPGVAAATASAAGSDEAALRALSREVSAAQELALRHVDDDRADVLRRRLGAVDAALREHERAAGLSLAEWWELVLDGDDAAGRRRPSAAAAAAANRGGGGGGLDGSSAASRRRELGLVSRWGRAAAAADAAASSDAAEAKQRREKELQSGLQEMGRIARQMKESAQRVGEQVGSGDTVIKRNQAAVEDASAALGKQLEKVDKKVLWFGGGGAAGSWMGSQLSFVLSFFTASVMVALVMAAVVLAFLFVVQVIVMFPSVVVVYEDGSPVNPGLIRRGFQLALYAGSSAVGGVAAAAESVVG